MVVKGGDDPDSEEDKPDDGAGAGGVTDRGFCVTTHGCWVSG